MKDMTPKEYLSQIKRLDMMIMQRIEQRAELEQLNGLSGQGIGEKVQSSPKGEAAFVRMVEKIDAINNEVNALINRYIDLKRKIIGQIQAMKNDQYIQVLYKKYVEGKRLEAISVEMNYSYHRLKHIHGYALKAFGDQFSDYLKIDT